ncbi:MAG TPA: response regulator [Dongiaceae bacterium]|nr:response regulator [Dongiaceae bacterium]
MSFISEKILVGHIGLTERDLTFIGNLFRLSAQQLSKFRFSDNCAPQDARILLVNTDQPGALAQWHDLHYRDRSKQGVLIGSAVPMRAPLPTLARPLVLKKFIQTLQQAEARLPQALRESLQVLVVDDSLPIRHYLSLRLPQLCESPMDIEFAETGEAAIDWMRKRPFDMVFLDIVLPGIDGYQACKQLKALRPSFVVMLTSNKSPFDRIKGTMSGCDAYLTKPPLDEQLAEVFGRMLVRARKAV